MQTTTNPEGQVHHGAAVNNSSTGGPGMDNTTQSHTDEGTWGSIKTWMIRWRGSRRLVLVIVAIALLLDNMLLTVVGE